MTPRFAGAVLAGGDSTRMGTDKAFVEVEGQPLIRRAIAALADAGAATVSAIGGDGPRLAELGLTVVLDVSPGDGPSQAILTALAQADDPDLLVVLSCDLVHPSARSIHAVVDMLESWPEAAVAVPLIDGSRQWLHAAWRRSLAMPFLAAARARGERSIWRAFTEAVVIDVEGIDADTVADADRPEDLPPSARH